jgi:hypothetical protein
MTAARGHGQVRIEWKPVVVRAAEIASSYSTPVTLRQLFYRLVSEGVLPNKHTFYKTLSARTAEARREGWFPDLLDQGREILRSETHDNPVEALETLARTYRRDLTEGQEQAVWLVLEKNTLIEQVFGWVDEFGIPVVALHGYGSQSIKDDVARWVAHDGRSAVALYVGDLDPSGEDIERDFQERTDYCFDEVRRLAVDHDQIAELGLVPAPGKSTDSRAASFVATYGELIQVEVEAIDPNVLRGLVRNAVEELTDLDRLRRVRRLELRERARLDQTASNLADLINHDDADDDEELS